LENKLSNIIPIADIKYATTDEAVGPLTTVIGIKCSDGVILASDSQFTANKMKILDGSKIFQINKFTALGAAGRISQMKELVDELKAKLGKNILTDLEVRKRIENVLLTLHLRYNKPRSEKIGYTVTPFRPSSILGVKLKSGIFKLYRLIFSNDYDTAVDPIEVYDAVGSGDLLAALVLKQQSRPINSVGKTLADTPLKFNEFIGSYVINEIKDFDTFTGGSTKVAVIDNEGFREIPDDEVSKKYSLMVDQLSNFFSSVLDKNNPTIKKIFKDIFPKDRK
jgi:20S proteasome alpha/beta subunit